ncbi:MAG: DNA primase family protein [Promethearchaeota archaeon]
MTVKLDEKIRQHIIDADGFLLSSESLFKLDMKDLQQITNDKRELRDKIIKLIVEKLILVHKYAYIVSKHDKYYAKYFKGKWIENMEFFLRALIANYIQQAGWIENRRLVNEILSRFQHDSFIPASEFMREDTHHYINFTNGILDLDTFKLEPHPPFFESRFIVQIPHDYKKDATCPKFDKILDFLLDGDKKRIELIWECIGYTLQSSVKFQKIFILVGRERTGKSTFLNILRAVLGKENTAGISLQALSNSRFGTWGIVNKVCNIYEDLSITKKVEDTGGTKTLIDKYLHFEKKGGEYCSEYLNITKHWFSCNKLPYVQDLDTAFARRFVILDFNHYIEEWSLDYESRITNDEQELEGIIAKAIEAYKRLLKRGYFLTQSDEEVLHRWRSETDPYYKFVEEYCVKDRKAYVKQDILYDLFLEFLDETGMIKSTKIPVKATFTNKMVSFGFQVRKRKWEGDWHRCYVGIKPSDEKLMEIEIDRAREEQSTQMKIY